MDLDKFENDAQFYEYVRKLHGDEHDPELMFQDWEGIPREFISECSLDAEYFEWREHIDASFLEPEVFRAAASLNIPWRDVEDAYEGEFSSWTTFAYQLVT